MSSPYHAKYFAHLLTRQGGEGVDRLARSLFDACVELNPHQIEAAVFAMRSPLSQGVLLADEVGLGKTIEAGLVLCQYWAEQRRRLLVICPASIRKQWALELEEKFHIPTVILDAKTYREHVDAGYTNPFDAGKLVICSLHFASRRANEIAAANWDLVVIDEAHKLRNAYRESNRIGQNIRKALVGCRKLLLTATPLQNSLLELYGLASIIDERIFGNLPAFKMQFTNVGGDLVALRERLRAFCQRTLRSQVLEYIKYTERHLITRPFQPTEQEHRLYEAVSEFLQRDDSYALPSRQRHLTTLVVRKLLASSAHAVAGTLDAMRARLELLREKAVNQLSVAELLTNDLEIDEEALDELLEGYDLEEIEEPTDEDTTSELPLNINFKKLDAEIGELRRYAEWAHSIGIDTKTRSLLKALEIGFVKMAESSAEPKAVIFTESRRTQRFVADFLRSNGYAGKVATFNGTNREPDTTEIYEKWLLDNAETGRGSGSRAIDIRIAIIEHFRDHATILVATEAASEGINLQFCSLVINFDLPWNPQRVEQRIGRCHRYGQKHDVVVINFLNKRNEADRRVYELLSEKFRLFTGVFGASDEVLGSIESGVDFERRVLDIYQKCRTPEEIEIGFQQLRKELDDSISERMRDTRQTLLEHFDEDVHDRLNMSLTGTREQLDRLGRMLWELTQFVLKDCAAFNNETLTFELITPPVENIKRGRYHLISKDKDNVSGDFLYRLSHPLSEYAISAGKSIATPVAEIKFDISSHPKRISVIEELKGESGWILLQRLVIDSYEKEESLLFSGFTDNGTALSHESCEKLFNCHGSAGSSVKIPPKAEIRLMADAERYVNATINTSLERNNRHFNEAREQLEKWADDMVLEAERELSNTKNQIKLLNRQARQAVTVQEQHDIQGKIKKMERKQRRLRQRIFDVEDEIAEKRDTLIDALEKRLQQRTTCEQLFTLRWRVI